MSDTDEKVKSFEFTATQEELDLFAEMNSCGTINSHSPKKSKGKVFSFGQNMVVCVSSVSSGKEGNMEVGLSPVIEAKYYQGPKPARNGRGYTGVSLKSQGKTWIITDIEITLKRAEKAKR